jgi:putative transposase
LTKYLSLLDWTGRQLPAGKRGAMPGHLASILDRLAVNREGWLDMAENFGRWFQRVVGRADSLTSA